MQYILYNPFAGNGTGKETALQLSKRCPEAVCVDMCELSDYRAFFETVGENDVILCGGDGTLNRFLNAITGIKRGGKLYLFPCGSGNDFVRDIPGAAADEPICIEEYVHSLPTVAVNGKKYAFLNGVGFGIDGYCCEVGDRMREQNRHRQKPKKINYTAIAIKGLLFHFKPCNARVTVDGREYAFKKVWIAPTMHGKYYGGGMMPAPKQVRNHQDGTLSLMVFHGSGKLKTLMIFPSLFKGEHVRHEKYVTVLSGKDITVMFDQPQSLQIDGETVLGVRSYRAKAAKVLVKA